MLVNKINQSLLQQNQELSSKLQCKFSEQAVRTIIDDHLESKLDSVARRAVLKQLKLQKINSQS